MNVSMCSRRATEVEIFTLYMLIAWQPDLIIASNLIGVQLLKFL